MTPPKCLTCSQPLTVVPLQGEYDRLSTLPGDPKVVGWCQHCGAAMKEGDVSTP